MTSTTSTSTSLPLTQYGGSEVRQGVTQCWPGGAALAVNLRHDLLQQVPVLRGGEDQQGELDGVGGGLRPGSEQITLEEEQLAPGEGSRLVASGLKFLEIEVSQTVWRVPLSQVSFSLPRDLLVYCSLSLLASSKYQRVISQMRLTKD